MSLPDTIKKAFLPLRSLIAIAVMAVAVAGCTVQPLYSGGGNGGLSTSVAPDMRSKLASIAIEPANNVFQQTVRNRLIFLLGGGAGEPQHPVYTLRMGLTHSTISALTVDVGESTDRTGRPSAGSVRGTSNYVLLDNQGKPVAKGNRTVFASFDRPRQEFANLRAERDAQKRAADELAEQIFLSLAQNMSKL
ncbi:LPS assembly lipoprotein LptE [Brucellaceae bacterium C25G]